LPPDAFPIGSKYAAPDPTGGAYSAPPDPITGKGGGAPGMGPPKGGPPGRGAGGREWEERGGGEREKLLSPDVRFYG